MAALIPRVELSVASLGQWADACSVLQSLEDCWAIERASPFTDSLSTDFLIFIKVWWLSNVVFHMLWLALFFPPRIILSFQGVKKSCDVACILRGGYLENCFLNYSFQDLCWDFWGLVGDSDWVNFFIIWEFDTLRFFCQLCYASISFSFQILLFFSFCLFVNFYRLRSPNKKPVMSL